MMKFLRRMVFFARPMVMACWVHSAKTLLRPFRVAADVRLVYLKGVDTCADIDLQHIAGIPGKMRPAPRSEFRALG
jgi:hypothetical protein